jgi:hypothetical protein
MGGGGGGGVNGILECQPYLKFGTTRIKRFTF